MQIHEETRVEEDQRGSEHEAGEHASKVRPAVDLPQPFTYG